MPRRQAYSAADEQKLADDIGAFAKDPYGFVMYAFPWGEEGTALENEQGPDEWQKDQLNRIGRGVSIAQVIREAIASGHGIGKSTFVAWITLWAMSTCTDTRGIITANTAGQLSTKTWAELSKWYHLMICRHWFDLTATRLCSSDPEHADTWRIDAVPWSETNTEAFAGLHNKGRRILVIFDEASAIIEKIWEVTEGALTDDNTEIIWLVFGNPTRNSGRFHACFHRFRDIWGNRQIDGRTVRITNKALIKEWIDTYGEDSDFVRVRVRGLFPRAGSMQLISTAAVDHAQKREPVVHWRDPLVLGVDIARHGDDQTVIWARKGRDARSIPPIKLRVMDTMVVASRIAEEASRLRPQAIFLDATGMGWGVFDRLIQLRTPNVFAIDFSTSPDRTFEDNVRVRNKRAEMYWSLRLWMNGGAIPEDDMQLYNEVTAIEYGYTENNEIQIERKKDFKKRIGCSPDNTDALALTFAHPVGQLSESDLDRLGPFDTIKRRPAYDPLEEDWSTDPFKEKGW